MTIEDTIYKILNDNFGSVHESIDAEVKQEKVQAALEGFEQTIISFKQNPSSTNWNMMLTTMANYQYWVQKRVNK